MRAVSCILFAVTVMCFLPATGAEAQLFYPGVEYWAGDSPLEVAISDLNNDGIPDLATTNYFSDSVWLLLGNGDGTFQAAVSYLAGDEPSSVAIGDLDGDGHNDLAVANSYSDDLSVLLGQGDGTFPATVHYPAGEEPRSVVVADLDDENNHPAKHSWAVKQALMIPNQPCFAPWSDARICGQVVLGP